MCVVEGGGGGAYSANPSSCEVLQNTGKCERQYETERKPYFSMPISLSLPILEGPMEPDANSSRAATIRQWAVYLSANPRKSQWIHGGGNENHRK